jgi:hypothetical protein
MIIDSRLFRLAAVFGDRRIEDSGVDLIQLSLWLKHDVAAAICEAIQPSFSQKHVFFYKLASSFSPKKESPSELDHTFEDPSSWSVVREVTFCSDPRKTVL